MHPAEIWQRSGRWETMADVMFRLTDHKGAVNVLAVTHEEIFALLAQELNSHKQLPQVWYQFQTKFRDEPRPRAGLLRVREFTMKDSYSFDLDRGRAGRGLRPAQSGLPADLRAAGHPGHPGGGIQRGHGRQRLDRVHVPLGRRRGPGRALPGLRLRGQRGEGHVAAGQRCADGPGLPAPERFDTPGVRTIEDLATGYDAPADRQIKTLVYVLDGKLTLVLMRGDHALNEQKLADATGAATIRPGPAGRDQGGARRAARQPGRGRGEQPAGDRRRGAARPPGHGHRGQRRRHAPARRGRGPRHRLGCLVRPARGPLGRTVRPVRGAAGAADRRSRSGTSSSSATSSPRRSASPCSTRPASGCTRSWAATGSGSSARWPPSSSATTTSAASSGRWPWRRSAWWWSSPSPRTPRSAKAGADIYEQLIAAGVEVIIDDRAERAGVKFRDAELTGIPVPGDRGQARPGRQHRRAHRAGHR